MQSVDNAWMKFFLTYDPAPTLQKVTVPVLALFGGLDLQVPAEANRAAIMGALDKGGNKDHTAKVFPDANHLYQSAKTGSPAEYATLKPEFTAGFLDTVSDWILAHVGDRQPKRRGAACCAGDAEPTQVGAASSAPTSLASGM